MAKYLVQASYTTEGMKGLLKDGGRKRRQAVEKLIGSVGGTVESVYYAFGKHDVIAIIDLPDNVSAAAASMTIGASGAVTNSITVLLTPEDIDAAIKKSPTYTPPGR